MRRLSDFPPDHFTGWSPADVVKALGWKMVKDASELEEHCGAVVREFPAQAEELRAGKRALVGFFIAKVMERTAGGADPTLTRRLLEGMLLS